MPHPRMYNASDQLLNRLRGICLGFPRVIEKEAWGECTFRVAGGKMFAMTDNNHHESGHVAVWVLAPPNIQEHLIRSMPSRFFKPPYVGSKGWVGVRIDSNLDWDQLAAILWDGYLMSAPAQVARSRIPGSKASTGHPRTTSESDRKRRKSRAATSRTR
ncbi:MAG: MmcQ/YjbR family DNA-binding protein [Acidobacteria bacterium]|nr:MmcQ/YjbR family DNA-binding protein [Acidobacteriota bacterium]